MKLRNLIVAAIACLTAFIACETEKVDTGISVDPTVITLPQDGLAVSVTVTVGSTQGWKATTGADWLQISHPEGYSSMTIQISADPNNGRDREGTIVFRTGVEEAVLKVIQPGALGQYQAAQGDGSKDSPFNVQQAFDAVKDLTYTDSKNYDKVGPYYVTGLVAKVGEAYSSEYGNGTFVISDDGTEEGITFTCYRIMYLEGKKWQEGNTQIKVGDLVVIYGELMYFGTGEEGKSRTPETVQSGSYLVSLNGETQATGGIVIDYNACEALTVEQFIAKGEDGNYYKLTGKVSRFNATYCSFDLTDDSGNKIYVYSVENKADWVDKISNDATVTLAGKYKLYKKEGAADQNEVVDAHIISCEGGTPAVDPNAAAPKTVAEFIQLADGDTYYKLTGKVSNFSSTYCSFDLTDDSGSIYVYSVKNKSDWSSKITNGATVVLAGQYMYYEQKQQHEVVNAYIISCEGGTQTQDSQPKGSGTLDDPYNAAMAKKVASELAKDAKSDVVYVAGKIASIKYTFSAAYGTATFDISDDGTTNVTTFTCYSVLYLGNRAWADGDTQVAVGDEVIICGKLTNYNGNTPETASKDAYIYSLNGVTDGGDPAPVVKNLKASFANGTLILSWDPVTGADHYKWDVLGDDGMELVWGITHETSVQCAEGYTNANADSGDGVKWNVDVFPYGQFVVNLWALDASDSMIVEGQTTLTYRDSGNTEATSVTWDKAALAAAACKGAVNQMDNVISFTNSTDYGTTEVTEMRIYKGKDFTVTAASGYKIVQIDITCTANGTTKQGPGCWGAGAPHGYSYDANGKTGQWLGSESSVKFNATDNQVRIAELTVYYVAE